METEKTAFKTWALSVCQVIQGIPRGHVLTYGEVARLAGPGGSARRVSMAMRYAPKGVKLPWHRVINAQGKISFPPDHPHYLQQKNRLEDEGVKFKNDLIDLQRFGYQGALDALLWGSPPAGQD
ncbi:MAG: MGMT family protein [Xanthomonadales bacterium]|nr:MGMT family protein [Xanthomonadales bacterium]